MEHFAYIRYDNSWPGYFEEPAWRPMKEHNWRELGLAPKPPVIYEP
jgi:hypothetical protein